MSNNCANNDQEFIIDEVISREIDEIPYEEEEEEFFPIYTEFGNEDMLLIDEGQEFDEYNFENKIV